MLEETDGAPGCAHDASEEGAGAQDRPAEFIKRGNGGVVECFVTRDGKESV
jgi:hypothetical protein